MVRFPIALPLLLFWPRNQRKHWSAFTSFVTTLRIFYRIALAVTGQDDVDKKSMAITRSCYTNRTVTLDNLRNDQAGRVSPTVQFRRACSGMGGRRCFGMARCENSGCQTFGIMLGADTRLLRSLVNVLHRPVEITTRKQPLACYSLGGCLQPKADSMGFRPS
jgi:hypothetical protein